MAFIKLINRTVVPVLFFSAMFFLFGCKKHYIKKHYPGTFEFTDQQHSWQTSQPNHDTIIVYTGTITYLKRNVNANLRIKFTSSDSVDVYVYKDGSFLEQYFDQTALTGGFSDEDHLEFTYTRGGSAGGVTDHVVGVRK